MGVDIREILIWSNFNALITLGATIDPLHTNHRGSFRFEGTYPVEATIALLIKLLNIS